MGQKKVHALFLGPRIHHSPKQNMENLMTQKTNLQKFEQKHISDMSGKFQTPIMLPLTVHSDDPFSIRILGPPQVVFPVAVGRKTDLLVSSLLIDPLLFGSIPIPSSLPISNGIPGFSIPIKSLSSSAYPPTTAAAHPPQPPPIKRARLSVDARPLDLSMKMPKPKPSTFPPVPANLLSLASTLGAQIPTTSIPSKLPPPPSDDRPFKCKCGVEFTSEKVYTGHKNFYCPMRPHADEENTPRYAVQKVSLPQACILNTGFHSSVNSFSFPSNVHIVTSDHHHLQIWVNTSANTMLP